MGKVKKVLLAIIKFFRTINKYNWRYKIVALAGLIFRVVFLPMIIPDFFELIFPFLISWKMPNWLYQIVLRIFLLLIDLVGLSNIFYIVSYASTGLCYKRNSAPALGSAFYTFFYFAYSLIPVLLIKYFYWWVIIVIFVSYFFLCWGIYAISDACKSLPDGFPGTFVAHLIITVVVFVAVLLIKGLCF